MTQRAGINLQVFEGKMPEQAASMLLQHFGGDARKAEVECWKIWESFVGGEVARRRDPENESARYFVQVIKCITDGTETPLVPRVSQQFSAAFKG